MAQIVINSRQLVEHPKTIMEHVLRGGVVLVTHYGKPRAAIIPAEWLERVLAAEAPAEPSPLEK